MKKFAIILFMSLFLAGCSANKFDYGKTISQEEYKNCFTIVELNNENWKDYFEVVDIEEEDLQCPGYNNVYKAIKVKDDGIRNLCGYSNIDFQFEISNRYVNKEYNRNTKEIVSQYEDDYFNTDYSNAYMYLRYNMSDENKIDNFFNVQNCYQSSYWNINGEIQTYSVTTREIEYINLVSVKGTLCFANYPDEIWTSNSNNERYFSINCENGVTYTLFDNGLMRWEKGSGNGWSNYNDLFATNYYDFFEN